ncbi:hypothetical protein HK101_001824 [Irineochytrium annulatum]|nr:hypothetical protein HK101_001824 [Irineochytrium annulatum]
MVDVPLGSIHVLQEYARERYVKNLGMMVAVDAIGRVFRSDFQPLVWARSLGFDLVNRIPQIKSGTVACKERVEKTHIEKERSKMAALPNVRVPFSQLTKFADPKNLWWKAPSLHAWVWNFNPPTSQIGLIELDRNVFGVPNRQDILYRALRYEQSWKEGGTESSKALGQVRGSTRKIVPQKGRGAARHGSKRSALFVGGYNVHGPRPHDKTTDLQKKVYNLAIRTALSVKFAQNQLFVVDSLSMNELSKSKLYESLKGMEVFGKKCYCMYGSDEPETMLIRSADATTKSEEGKQVLVSSARNISVGPVLENNFLICDKSAIEVLEEMYREDEAYEDDEDGED